MIDLSGKKTDIEKLRAVLEYNKTASENDNKVDRDKKRQLRLLRSENTRLRKKFKRIKTLVTKLETLLDDE